jgi:energy-coupling factor transporter transmembrane protein EcfT
MNKYTHPHIRVLVFAIIIIGSLVCNSLFLIALASVVCTTLIILNGLSSLYYKFVLFIVIPMFFLTAMVWGVWIAAPPHVEVGTDPYGGFTYSIIMALRIMVIGGASQLLFLTIKPIDLPSYLRFLGFSTLSIVVILSSLALLPEVKLRLEQILIARAAKGLLKCRSFFSGAMQLPYLIRPLVIWVLNSAVSRAEGWTKKLSVIQLLENRILHISMRKSILSLVVCSLWFGLVVYSRI